MSRRLETRLTRKLDLLHPIVSAPMALAAGGRLAAAVTDAGGLGLIGGGYGDPEFLAQAYRDAGNARTGCGFITWSLAKQPELLGQVLAHNPAAMMLSFGDPRPFASTIHSAQVPLICQCQTLQHVQEALDAGAVIIVAQGTEAGGHGATRGTFSFVAEVSDLLAQRAPNVLLLAAGGIADGRGLAAAIMLGADGVLVGTRFWAAQEALAHPGHQARAITRDGDSTVRTRAVDVIRELHWPEGYTIRVGRNAFTDRWDGEDDALRAELGAEIPRYRAAAMAGDAEHSAAVYGEAAGLIHAVEPAKAIVARMVCEAIERLAGQGGATISQA
ncbi:COG2070 Dioxygenases related to 2-nitropropane dioxygenase [Rhabdaerophilaceae bacterium]